MKRIFFLKNRVLFIKRLIILNALVFCQFIWAQEIVKIADVNSVSQGVNEALPFDRPIILKYNTREAIQVEYIGLIKISNKDVVKYYNEFLSNQGLFMPHSNGVYPNEELRVSQTILSTGENKYQLNISLPPLEPNRFYDI